MDGHLHPQRRTRKSARRPIILLSSILALVDGAPADAETIPAAVAYRGQNWDRPADGPVTRRLVASGVQELLGRVGQRVALKNLGQHARLILGHQPGYFLQLLYMEPQALRDPDGKIVGWGRYIVLWWGRDGLPDLVLCGESPDRLGAAFAMPLLGHLEAVMERAPFASRSVVLAASLPVTGEGFLSYPYTWSLTTDRGTYSPGKPVRFKLAMSNASGFSVPLDFVPPMLLIRTAVHPTWDVALIPYGDGHRGLEPGETATFDIV